VLTHGEEIEQAKEAWISNHKLVQARSSSLQRNPNGWGEETDNFFRNELSYSKLAVATL
jgi:hypothetical protein